MGGELARLGGDRSGGSFMKGILTCRAPGWQPRDTVSAKGLSFQLWAEALARCTINKGGTYIYIYTYIYCAYS